MRDCEWFEYRRVCTYIHVLTVILHKLLLVKSDVKFIPTVFTEKYFQMYDNISKIAH